MIQYSLIENEIFYVTFSETIDVENIKTFLHEFKNIGILPENLLAFYNLQNATMKLSWVDILVIANLAKKVTAPFKSVRTVFLVNEPTNTAYSMLFIQSPSHKKSVRKVFSTEDAAMEWLLENQIKK